MSFKVRIEPSGHEFEVTQDESLLDAALHRGLNLPYGCRGGTCGSCKAKVVEGVVDYGGLTPQALTDQEAAVGMVLPCLARPRSDVVIEAREIASGDELRVKKLPARVASKDLLAPDVVRVMLKLPAGERLQFLAGQYIDFVLKDGRHRSFSLANAPHDDGLLELHIRHVEKGEFTEHVLYSMHEKDIVRIEGPHGDFYLREESTRPMIFVAGGTGFAPIKGIIEHAFAAGVQRPMTLYWGARARVDLYLNELPERWAAEHDNFSYTPVLSDPAAEDGWSGETGFVHEVVARAHPDLSGVDLYAAGPPVMVRAMRDAAVSCGLPIESFYSDPFEFAPDTLAKQQQAESQD